MATYFSPDFMQFFKDLSQNNNRDWFHENKKRYEKEVKNPFMHFMTDLIAEVQKHDDSVDVQAKDCIMRINRDIRFAADKTPYNLHRTGFVSSGGKKNKSIPGIFVRFSPDELALMSGCYGLDKEQLLKIRTKIAANLSDFKKLYTDNDFVAKFGEIRGDEHKRIPKEFQDANEVEPLIAKKQLYYVGNLDSEMITSDKLIERVMEYWHTARPLNTFLKDAIV